MDMETILKQTTSFRDDLLKDLKDTEFAMYYLEAALADYKEDSNTEALLAALRDVTEAQGGIGKLAERAKINPQHLNNMLISEQNPRLDNLLKILSGLGSRLCLDSAES